MIAKTGVDGVTVARGAIGNPWIFRQVRALAAGGKPSEPSVEEQGRVLEEHYRLAEEAYGPRRACPVMRGMGIKQARLHPESEAVRAAFVAVRNPGDWRAVLDRWYK
jgi:tRNA-dihydrouridine synthase